METFTFTASQTAVIGVFCFAAGIITGAWLVLHIGGGILPRSKE